MTSITEPIPVHKKAAYILLGLTVVSIVCIACFAHLSRQAHYYAFDSGRATKAQAHNLALQLHEDDEAGRDAFQAKQMDLEDRYDTYAFIAGVIALATLSSGITCALITKVDIQKIRVLTGLTIILITIAIVCFNLSDEASHRADTALDTGLAPNGVSAQKYQNEQMELGNRYNVAWLVASAGAIAAFTSAIVCATAPIGSQKNHR
jgi:hypothetical protein